MPIFNTLNFFKIYECLVEDFPSGIPKKKKKKKLCFSWSVACILPRTHIRQIDAIIHTIKS